MLCCCFSEDNAVTVYCRQCHYMRCFICVHVNKDIGLCDYDISVVNIRCKHDIDIGMTVPCVVIITTMVDSCISNNSKCHHTVWIIIVMQPNCYYRLNCFRCS